MVALTKNEILEELEKFGITSPEEVMSLINEYSRYYYVEHNKDLFWESLSKKK